MKIRFAGNLHGRPELDAQFETAPADDAERVLLAYRKWGETCVTRLHGDFSFLIAHDNGDCFGARDRLGVQPFFYSLDGTRLRYERRPGAFGKTNIDEEAFVFALANDWATVDRTLNGAHRLPAGCLLTFRDGALNVRRYHELVPGPPVRYRNPQEYAEHLRELFDAAVRDALPPTGAAGLLLSGGVDSSSIASLAHRARPNALETFSARFACASCDDPDGLTLALSIGNWPRHLFYPERDVSVLSPHPEERELFHYPTLSIFRPLFAAAASRGIALMLSGCGGDDIFTPPANRIVDHLPERWITLVRRHFPRAAPELIHPKLAKRFRPMERVAERYRRERPAGTEGWRAGLLRRLFLWGGYAQSFEQEQIFAARFGIERRYPLFDLRLIDYAFRIPREQMVSGGVGKRVLRDAMHNALPERQLNRIDPTDFTPLNRRALARVDGATIAPTLIRREIVTANGVAKLWAEREKCASHEPLFRLMALERIACGEKANEARREGFEAREETLPGANA